MENKSLKKLQSYELDMMMEIIRICEKYNLTYYLMGGTLIGAVRHKGFIPWDDDIDIGMPRPDYEKFNSVAQKELRSPFGLLSIYNDSSYQFTFTKVIHKNMKILYKNTKNEKKWNIWIDVFPLDSMPKNKVHFFFRKYYLLYRRAMCMLSCLEDVVSTEKKNRPFHEKALIYIGKTFKISSVLNTEKQIKKFDKSCKKYAFERGEYMVNAMGLYKFKTVFTRDVYGNKTFLEFEGVPMQVPEKYHDFLKRLYGDYMKLPPEKKRNHHKIEFIEVK